MRLIAQRKVKLIGDSYHISLPIQWVRDKKLDETRDDGAVVTLKENNEGNLEIITGE